MSEKIVRVDDQIIALKQAGSNNSFGTMYETDLGYFRILSEFGLQEFRKMCGTGLIAALEDDFLIKKHELLTGHDENSEEIWLIRTELIDSPPVCQWPIAIVIDAAITTLKVKQISKSYGMSLSDAHLFNLRVDKNKTWFVDIGSIYSNERERAWLASGEFRTEILNVIDLLNSQYSRIARFQLSQDVPFAGSPIEYLSPSLGNRIIVFLGLDSVSLKLQNRLANIGVFNYRNAILHFSDKNSREKYLVKYRNRLAIRILIPIIVCISYPCRYFLAIRPEQSLRKLQKAQKRIKRGFWSDYYQPEEHLGSHPLSRFVEVLPIIKAYGIQRNTDIGGNTGEFSRLLLANDVVQSAVSLDFDDSALTAGISITEKDPNPISFGYLDFTVDTSPRDVSKSSQISDCVSALAIVHHLVLRNRLTFDFVIGKIASYTSNLALVEFMPLGMWDGKSSNLLPNWYSERDFRRAFESEFNLEHRIQTEENRILYIGSKKSK
jgi:hypothetical protein